MPEIAFKWIKITTGMFDDEKIKIIESIPDRDTILIIWIKLIAQAGRTNANGYIFLSENIPYTDEMLATIFNRPLNTIRLALETFKKFGMIQMDDKGIYINNFAKYQNVEGMERYKELNRERQKRFREKQKELPPAKKTKSNVTLRYSNGTDIEVDKDKEKNIYNGAFEKFWNLYPSSKGKKAAYQKWKARIKEGMLKETLATAARNYSTYVQSKGTTPDFIMHAKTFLGSNEYWKDYEEPITPSNNKRSKQTGWESIEDKHMREAMEEEERDEKNA